MRTGHTYWRSYILVNLGADSLPAAEQEVVDRVIRRKLQREYDKQLQAKQGKKR